MLIVSKIEGVHSKSLMRCQVRPQALSRMLSKNIEGPSNTERVHGRHRPLTHGALLNKYLPCSTCSFITLFSLFVVERGTILAAVLTRGFFEEAIPSK